jgi:hypothetical protein
VLKINGKFKEDEWARFVGKVRDIVLAAQQRVQLEEKRMMVLDTERLQLQHTQPG